MKRPLPPSDDELPRWDTGFTPDPALEAWVKSTFVEEEGELVNPDHAHLAFAHIGWLWTTAPNLNRGRTVIGEAKLISPPQTRWNKAMADWQLRQWFGSVPDALIVLSAQYADECNDLEFCALVEHELYHIAQSHDDYGAPRFSRAGLPILEMRAHDVEEFVGVVDRYGPVGQNVAALVDAASRSPSIGRASIARACGTCQLRAA